MENTTEKKYELRDLKASDLAKFTKILSKIGVKDLSALFSSSNLKSIVSKNGKDASAVGAQITLNIVGVVCEHYADCSKDLTDFLSDLSGIPVIEINDMPMEDAMEMVVELIQKEQFKRFLSVASKLLQ